MTGTPRLRWGVLGATSWVAGDAVIPALRRSRSAQLVAVASRDPQAARRLATGTGAGRGHASYAALLDDPTVEAVYIPLPNSMHREWTERAAAAGKHVLCEKPLAPGADDARAMASACERAGVVLMEAYMTAHHPRSAGVVELVRGGALGELRSYAAVFGFTLRDPLNHRWRPEMGGGALLDVGIYCLAPLLAIAGRDPVSVAAVQTPGGAGVDATTVAWLDLGGGLAAVATCSFETPAGQRLIVTGTRGELAVDRAALTPGPRDSAVTVTDADGTTTRRRLGAANSYLGMVEHFARVVRGDEPPRRTPADSVRLLALLDRIGAAARSRAPGDAVARRARHGPVEAPPGR